jgi:glycosyltransferase involved in cell wall biosynthesis
MVRSRYKKNAFYMNLGSGSLASSTPKVPTGSRLSILLPAHNASRTISLSLASTLIFKPKGAAVLIFLDGNNTNSRFLNYAAKRPDVKVFSSDETLGISGALNFLLKKASSDLVARMDADDICLPGRFKKAMSLITADRSDFVFMNTILFGKTLAPLFFVPQLPIRLNPAQSEAMLLIANPFAHPTMVAKKEALLGLGGYRPSVAEDYDLWLRAQNSRFRLTRLRGYGLLYRRHPGQYTKQENFYEKEKADPLLQDSKRIMRTAYADRHGLNSSDHTIDSLVVEELSRTSFWLSFQLRTLPKILSLLRIKL